LWLQVVAPGDPEKQTWRMERPKIFRCPSNNQWTMWFHCDTISFGIESVGVLTAPDIRGEHFPCFILKFPCFFWVCCS
jgi:hypothetical protein